LYTQGGRTSETTDRGVVVESLSPTGVPSSEEEGMGEAREIEVEGSEFSFSPSSITFAQGEKVRLTFKNTGKNPHNFVIDELGVSTKTIPGGGSDTVEFTAGKSGTFTFYCAVGNHRQQGMEGELNVQ